MNVVRLFLRPGVGGGETEIKAAHMYSWGIYNLARNLCSRNSEKRTLLPSWEADASGRLTGESAT